MGQVAYLWLCNRDVVKLKTDVRCSVSASCPTSIVSISQLAQILYGSVRSSASPSPRIPSVASKFWGIPPVISSRFTHYLASVACFVGDRCGTLETAFDVCVTT